jgi:hypothetical protein
MRLNALDPFRRIKMRDHFCIAGGGGVSAAPFELAPELDVVVDFAVLRDGDAVADADGLVSAGDVDDAEPRRAECGGTIGKETPVVRTAMLERRDHSVDALGRRRRAVQRDETRYATHVDDSRRPVTAATSSTTNPATRSAAWPSRNWHWSSTTWRRPSRSSSG